MAAATLASLCPSVLPPSLLETDCGQAPLSRQPSLHPAPALHPRHARSGLAASSPGRPPLSPQEQRGDPPSPMPAAAAAAAAALSHPLAPRPEEPSDSRFQSPPHSRAHTVSQCPHHVASGPVLSPLSQPTVNSWFSNWAGGTPRLRNPLGCRLHPNPPPQPAARCPSGAGEALGFALLRELCFSELITTFGAAARRSSCFHSVAQTGSDRLRPALQQLTPGSGSLQSPRPAGPARPGLSARASESLLRSGVHAASGEIP